MADQAAHPLLCAGKAAVLLVAVVVCGSVHATGGHFPSSGEFWEPDRERISDAEWEGHSSYYESFIIEIGLHGEVWHVWNGWGPWGEPHSHESTWDAATGSTTRLVRRGDREWINVRSLVDTPEGTVYIDDFDDPPFRLPVRRRTPLQEGRCWWHRD